MIRMLALCTLLGACAVQPADPAGDPPSGQPAAQDCDASRARDLIGRPATEELGREALARTGARTLRWIRPGQAVTMDYNPQRLNIKLDGRDRAEAFTCG